MGTIRSIRKDTKNSRLLNFFLPEGSLLALRAGDYRTTRRWVAEEVGVVRVTK